jgi:hypothetical protein
VRQFLVSGPDHDAPVINSPAATDARRRRPPLRPATINSIRFANDPRRLRDPPSSILHLSSFIFHPSSSPLIVGFLISRLMSDGLGGSAMPTGLSVTRTLCAPPLVTVSSAS